MFRKLLQICGVSCGHRNLTHPFATAVINKSQSQDWDTVKETGGHYVVCLECGKKFQYDWGNMRVIW